MPINFTDEEWKEYMRKIAQLEPLSDKEWKEYSDMIRANSPNREHYYVYKDKTITTNEPLDPSFSDRPHLDSSFWVSKWGCVLFLLFLILGSIAIYLAVRDLF